jgi:haloalkane dehalogenase
MIAPSAVDRHPRFRLSLLGTEIAFVDIGRGSPVVFLHGNPTSSYLWRNVIPHVSASARCLAPDLVGMGDSGRAPDGRYRLFDHQRYLDAWFDALRLDRVVLVVHDWGGPLGFSWAHRHEDRVAGICHMETLLQPLTWDEWPESGRRVFEGMRSQAGEELVLERNVFVERILPASVMRTLEPEVMDRYRKPFAEPGESRRPVLQWPREIPLDGKPADVADALTATASWLLQTPLPKLFINAEPGFLSGPQRAFSRRLRNQTEVSVRGIHFIQEDSPDEIGGAVAEFVRGALTK